MFHDMELANENLAVLNTLPAVEAACLYDARGAVFAQLSKNKDKPLSCPLSIKDEKTRFETVHLLVVQPIIVDEEELGHVYIHADFTQAYWRKIEFTGLLFLVLVAVTTLTFFLTAPLLRLISSPIKNWWIRLKPSVIQKIIPCELLKSMMMNWVSWLRPLMV